MNEPSLNIFVNIDNSIDQPRGIYLVSSTVAIVASLYPLLFSYRVPLELLSSGASGNRSPLYYEGAIP